MLLKKGVLNDIIMQALLLWKHLRDNYCMMHVRCLAIRKNHIQRASCKLEVISNICLETN